MLLIKGRLVAKSPFMIGNGEGRSSDRDVFKDRDGRPFIPGTTLAGVIRHYLMEQGFEEEIEEIFGCSKYEDGEDRGKESRIIVYDAFSEGEVSFGIRDSVRLHEKLTVDKSKFDYEIVEAGASFPFRMEVNLKRESHLKEDDLLKIFGILVNGFEDGEIRIGAKTMRGFGDFLLESSEYLSLDLMKKAEMDIYLSGDFSKSSFLKLKPVKGIELYETLEKRLSLKSFLLIRDNMTTERVDKDDKESKYVDSATLIDSEGNVVIPGTTLAGVFRHRCKRILEKSGYTGNITEVMNQAFGYETPLTEEGELGIADKEKRSRSKIRFSEIRMEKDGLTMLNRTRTAIDRFSGSALQTGALYTERNAVRKEEKPNSVLFSVKIQKNCPEFPLVKSLIEICLEELLEGYLSIGGNAAIGAGIFSEEEGEG